MVKVDLSERWRVYRYTYSLVAMLVSVTFIAILIKLGARYSELERVHSKFQSFADEVAYLERCGGELVHAGPKSVLHEDQFLWFFRFKTHKPILPTTITSLSVRYLMERPKEFEHIASHVSELEINGLIQSREMLQIMPVGLRRADLELTKGLLPDVARFKYLESLNLVVAPSRRDEQKQESSAKSEEIVLPESLLELEIQGYGLDDDIIGRLKGVSHLRRLVVRSDGFLGTGLANLDLSNNLESLDIEGQFDGNTMLQFPPLPNLKYAYIRSDSLRGDGLEWLANSKKLSSLTLMGMNLEDIALEKLVILPELDTISIVDTKIDGTGFAALSHLRKLRSIGVFGSPINRLGLMNMQMIENLEDLKLERTEITTDDISCFEQFHSLTSLEFGFELSEDELLSFAIPPRLKSLTVSGGKLSIDGYARFKERNPGVHLHAPGLKGFRPFQ